MGVEDGQVVAIGGRSCRDVWEGVAGMCGKEKLREMVLGKEDEIIL